MQLIQIMRFFIQIDTNESLQRKIRVSKGTDPSVTEQYQRIVSTLDLCSTGDAIVAGLQVLLAMQDADVSLRDLAAGLTKAPQVLVNVVVDSPAEVSRHPQLLKITANYEQGLGDRGRILVRPSGTEPLLRIMVEGQDEGEVMRIADDLAAHAKSIRAA